LRRFIFATAAAVALGMASMANATVHTMDVTWSGDQFGNSAKATGVFSFDDAFVPDLGGAESEYPAGDGLLSLSMDITGASSGNGHFVLSDFEGFVFSAFSPLNYSAELIGQAMTNGCNYGDLSEPCYPAASGDFNLFGNGNSAPNGEYYFVLTTDGGHGDWMAVTSIRPAGAVPEPAAWALMLGGFGLTGATLRRRRSAIA
jgi:hypothetical protein